MRPNRAMTERSHRARSTAACFYASCFRADIETYNEALFVLDVSHDVKAS